MLQSYDTRNANLIVNIGGRLLHRDEAGVSPFDSSVQNGDAVWEGLRLYRGKIFRLAAHLDRLRRGAAALAYERVPDEQTIRREIARTLEANGMEDQVHIRLTLSRGRKYTSGMDPRLNREGCLLIVLAEHKAPVYDAKGIRLVTAAHRRPPADVLDQKIHSCNQLTSILAKLEASAAGADDALMLDTRGFIAETNATHVFLVEGGAVQTPTTAACPEGITRQVVLDLCRREGIPCSVTDLTLAQAYRAEELFVTGTMGEITPVLELDGRAIRSREPGQLTLRLRALYQALTHEQSEHIHPAS